VKEQENGMKFLVAYDGGSASQHALALAREQALARRSGTLVYIVTSMGGGRDEEMADIERVEENHRWAKDFLLQDRIQCEAIQLARGLSPGEDIVKFAADNEIDMIFLGINKKSRTKKILLGSTAQYVILKGPCPVTTTK
jgi:nucleotide-binding universal stress UspA family protein